MLSDITLVWAITGLEAINATIQWVKKTARGFRNSENFKTAIYFHCGGLDLYPYESR
ncbi:MAG: transposase [Candidatus Methylomirabilota bacterium]|jgi:transposase